MTTDDDQYLSIEELNKIRQAEFEERGFVKEYLMPSVLLYDNNEKEVPPVIPNPALVPIPIPPPPHSP
jgi:hypothetical protein